MVVVFDRSIESALTPYANQDRLPLFTKLAQGWRCQKSRCKQYCNKWSRLHKIYNRNDIQ
jgi:hypothetical protein